MEMFRLAAEQNDDRSQYRLARFYEETAMKHYSLAAEQDNGNAQYSLGVMLR